MFLKNLARPLRIALGKFVLSPERIQDTLTSKVAKFVAQEKIEGDYLEFGVYAGSSFVLAYKAMREAFAWTTIPGPWHTERDATERLQMWEKMRFFAFDSFEGLPQPVGPDSLSTHFVRGKYASSKADFEKNLARNDIPMSRVVVVPGWFNNTLNAETRRVFDLKKAAIVYVDCDLYESAKVVLEFIEPLLIEGTVIVFDDWYTFKGNPSLGEQRAWNEWVKKQSDWAFSEYLKDEARNSFIANRCTPKDDESTGRRENRRSEGQSEFPCWGAPGGPVGAIPLWARRHS